MTPHDWFVIVLILVMVLGLLAGLLRVLIYDFDMTSVEQDTEEGLTHPRPPVVLRDPHEQPRALEARLLRERLL